MTTIHKDYKLLNDGNYIPTIGIGTWEITDPIIIKRVIQDSIELGYRHIDTASKYMNEEMIGEALTEMYSKNIITRKEIFITTKLWCTDFEHPELALQKSLDKLKTDYVDLYLIHYPVRLETKNKEHSKINNKEDFIVKELDIEILWKKMEEIKKSGKARSIGVSNFGINTLTKLLNSCEIKPAVQQIELHPYWRQSELRNFCQEREIFVVSYSALKPTLKGFKDEELKAMARKYKITEQNVILSYLRQINVGIIPKSTNKEHMKQNLNSVILEEEDLIRLENIKHQEKVVNPKYLGDKCFD